MTTAIVTLPTGFEASETGLTIRESLSQDEWIDAGREIAKCGAALQWWIGDWLNYGERAYGEIKESVEALGLNYNSCLQWSRVSAEFEIGKRLPNVPWSHHQAAASHPDKRERRKLLSVDKDGKPKLTVREIKDAVRDFKIEQAAQVNPWPAGKYRVIYADPPWSYNDQRLGTVEGGGAVAHYPLMPTEKIAELPVSALRGETCVLFMWATSPLLPDAFSVIAAWGFQYKASFVWDKVRGFNGHYNDVRHELMLVATHGSCVPDSESLPSSVFQVEKTRHSAKPKEARDIIDSLYPNGPRVELFAREVTEGWDAWGNEAVQ